MQICPDFPGTFRGNPINKKYLLSSSHVTAVAKCLLKKRQSESGNRQIISMETCNSSRSRVISCMKAHYFRSGNYRAPSCCSSTQSEYQKISEINSSGSTYPSTPPIESLAARFAPISSTWAVNTEHDAASISLSSHPTTYLQIFCCRAHQRVRRICVPAHDWCTIPVHPTFLAAQSRNAG